MRLQKKLFSVALALALLGVGAVIVYYLVFLHLVRVPTGSMSNTIVPGDHLVVKKRSFGEINRGDLIVFSYSDDPSTNYISRVVGLPGEILQVRGRLIHVNDRVLDEKRVTVKPDYTLESGMLEELSSEGEGSYRVFYFSGEGNDSEGDYGVSEPFKIPDGQYFVMSDNRDNSLDSRYKGPVVRAAIFGKPSFIYWSSHVDRSGTERTRWDRMFRRIK